MRAQRGFTLIEMLVALSISALLVSLVYGAVRIGQRSATAMNTQTENTEIMRIGWQFLHDAVTRARPVSALDTPDDHTGFKGTPDGLRFVADMPAYVGLGGLTRIRLTTERTHSGRQLLLTRQRFDRLSSTTAAPDEIESAVLVDELDRLRIAYFGKSTPDASPAWHSDWTDPEHLPNLVSISVTPGHGRSWPELIARPLTGAVPLGDDELPLDSDLPEDYEEETE